MIDDGIDRVALMRIFSAEAEENLAVMEAALVAIEKDGDADPEVINTIFRAAHTLKGNAASMDLGGVASIAHAAEGFLDDLRSGEMELTSEIVSTLLVTVDALRAHIALSGPHEKATGKRGAAPSEGPFQKKTAQSLRVSTAKLDAMLDLVGELAVAAGRVEYQVGTLEAFDQQKALLSQLQEVVLQTRMVPIAPLFQQQIRIVRGLAETHGKPARVVIEGRDVEVDTAIVERLRDPVTHMIRNAIDHGIESQRGAKDPIATITLRAFHETGSIVVQVGDDGGGIDRKRLAARATAMGLDVESLGDRELLRLILLPGFSTAAEVTELSGRGVGMDVVEKNVAALRGTIGIESEKGLGTTFSLRLPLTLALLPGLSVVAGDETYVLPLVSVTECLDCPEDTEDAVTGIVSVRGEAVPFLRLRTHLRAEGERSGREKLVIVESDRRRAALIVDDLRGETRVVVKPLGRLLRGLPAISGSAIVGGGQIALVLEVGPLVDQLSTRTNRLT